MLSLDNQDVGAAQRVPAERFDKTAAQALGSQPEGYRRFYVDLKEGLAFLQAEGKNGRESNDDPAVVLIISSLNFKSGLGSSKGEE